MMAGTVLYRLRAALAMSESEEDVRTQLLEKTLVEMPVAQNFPDEPI
jgi:hypothetical protein